MSSFFPSLFHLWKACHPLYSLPHLSQRSPHPSVDQTFRLFCLLSLTLSVFSLRLKTQSSSLHSLSCLPQRPPHPSQVQIPRLHRLPLSHHLSSLWETQSPPSSLHSLSFLPGRSSHPSLAKQEPFIITGCRRPPSFKKQRTSLASANVCNALHRETWWDRVERWMSQI